MGGSGRAAEALDRGGNVAVGAAGRRVAQAHQERESAGSGAPGRCVGPPRRRSRPALLTVQQKALNLVLPGSAPRPGARIRVSGAAGATDRAHGGSACRRQQPGRAAAPPQGRSVAQAATPPAGAGVAPQSRHCTAAPRPGTAAERETGTAERRARRQPRPSASPRHHRGTAPRHRRRARDRHRRARRQPRPSASPRHRRRARPGTAERRARRQPRPSALPRPRASEPLRRLRRAPRPREPARAGSAPPWPATRSRPGSGRSRGCP